MYIKISNFIFNQINNNRVELSCLYLANFHLTAEKYVVIFFLFIVNQLTGEEIILNILFFNIKYKKKSSLNLKKLRPQKFKTIE